MIARRKNTSVIHTGVSSSSVSTSTTTSPMSTTSSSSSPTSSTTPPISPSESSIASSSSSSSSSKVHSSLCTVQQSFLSSSSSHRFIGLCVLLIILSLSTQYSYNYMEENNDVTPNLNQQHRSSPATTNDENIKNERRQQQQQQQLRASSSTPTITKPATVEINTVITRSSSSPSVSTNAAIVVASDSITITIEPPTTTTTKEPTVQTQAVVVTESDKQEENHIVPIESPIIDTTSITGSSDITTSSVQQEEDEPEVIATVVRQEDVPIISVSVDNAAVTVAVAENITTESTIVTSDVESNSTTTTTTITEINSSVTVDVDDDDKHEWHVTIAHEPRYDLLGSFVLPTILLYSVTLHQNWTLIIFPFAGSVQHAILADLFAMKGNLSKDWGNGFQDASHRADYNPMELNEQSYEAMGFFPEVSKDLNIGSIYPWIRRKKIPQPGNELNDVCKAGTSNQNNNTVNECYILLTEDPYEITEFINMNGGIDKFITPEFGQHTRTEFLLKNQERLLQYNIANQTSITANTVDTNDTLVDKYYNVAIHIRRGDILHPDRWIDQQVFANVAKHICQMNHNNQNESIIHTNIHVFSSGPNRDGNWSIMESLAEPTDDNNNNPVCANVYLHIDEIEFDSWAFMVAADALVISTSTFSYVPGLIRYDNVYFPLGFWHPALSSFTLFDRNDGSIVSRT